MDGWMAAPTELDYGILYGEKMLEFSQINKSEFLFDELLARYKVSLVKQVNWLWAVQTRDSKTAKNIFYELQEILKVNNEKAQELSN